MGIAKPIRSVKMTKIVEHPEDAEFINKPKKVIFQIILAANYMDIKSLLHLGCAKIATLIKGKSPEEIKKILGDDDELQPLCAYCLKAGKRTPPECDACREKQAALDAEEASNNNPDLGVESRR